MSIIVEGLKDAFPLIAKVAPLLGSVIGGVPGIAASSALSLLAKAFGSDSSNLDNLAKAIVNHPAAENILQALEQTHAGWLTYIKNMKNLKKAHFDIELEWDSPSQSD